MHEMTKKVWIICVIGIIIGASIGYFYRPPAILTGQLPFGVVITRGGNLKGLDQIYLDVAKTSFNYLLIGGIVGGILGAIVGMKISNKIINKTN